MKANIEVDLREAFVGYGSDGEEYSADFADVIKSAVVENIINKQRLGIQNEIKTMIQEAVGKVIKEEVETQIKFMLNNFMKTPVIIADGYNKKEYESLLEYVEYKFSSLYKAELKGSSCSKDKLVEQIGLKIRNSIQSELRIATEEVKKIGREIGRKAVNEDTTIAALKTLLKDK